MTNILARPRVIGSVKKRVRRQKSSTTESRRESTGSWAAMDLPTVVNRRFLAQAIVQHNCWKKPGNAAGQFSERLCLRCDIDAGTSKIDNSGSRRLVEKLWTHNSLFNFMQGGRVRSGAGDFCLATFQCRVSESSFSGGAPDGGRHTSRTRRCRSDGNDEQRGRGMGDVSFLRWAVRIPVRIAV